MAHSSGRQWKVDFRLVRTALVAAVLAALPSTVLGQYKDQAESDVAQAAGKETDLQKKIDKLKEWEQKYPDSQLKGQRTLMVAQALLGLTTPAYGKAGPAELLDGAEKAGRQLADNLDNFFATSNKPAAVTDQQWADAKKQFGMGVHSSLGWIYYTQKKNPQAETEFKAVLGMDQNQAQVSYWLGSAIIRQNKPERYSEALYSFARSISVTGASALAPAAATAADAFLKKAYVGYHGDDSDLDKLKAAVAAGPLPAADYHIRSIEEIEKEKFANEDEFNKAHPDVALWRQLRGALKADGGDAYFANVKETQIPPDAIGMFKGKIVAVNDKDLVINVDSAAGDATLKFDKTVNVNKAVINVGDAIEFKAVVDAFAKDPYMLTMLVDEPKDSIKGLADNAFAAPVSAKKPAVKKAVVKAGPKGPAKK